MTFGKILLAVAAVTIVGCGSSAPSTEDVTKTANQLNAQGDKSKQAPANLLPHAQGGGAGMAMKPGAGK